MKKYIHYFAFFCSVVIFISFSENAFALGDTVERHVFAIEYKNELLVRKKSDSLRTVEVSTPNNFNTYRINFNYLNKDNGEYIIFQSDRGNYVYVNNINTKEVFTIPCAGPITGIYAIDTDSLYVHIPSINAICRYSIYSKEPIETLHYSPEILPDGKFYEHTAKSSGLVVSGGYAYVSVLANYFPNTYFTYPTIGVYKIGKDTLATQRFIGYFPEDMQKRFYYLFFSYFCAIGDRVVVSYQGAHDLKVYSKNGMDSSYVKAKSAFLRDTFALYESVKHRNISEGEWTVEYRQQQYGQMIYNPYLGLFLRIATEQREPIIKNDFSKYSLKRTVIVFDIELNLIDEIRIDKDGPIMPSPRGFFIYSYVDTPDRIKFIEYEIPKKKS